MAGLLLVAMAGATFPMGRAATTRFLSPASLYVAMWLLLVGLYLMPVVAYTDVGSDAWLAVFGSLAAFTGGCLFTITLAGRARPQPLRPQDALAFRVDRSRLERAILIITLLGTIGLIGYLKLVNDQFGVGVFFSGNSFIVRQAEATEEFQREFGPAKFLNYLNFAIPPLLMFYYRVFPKGAALKLIVCAVPTVASAALSLDRTQPFFVIMWTAFIYLLLTGKSEGRRLLVAALAVGGLLIVVFLAVGAVLGKTAENNPLLLSASLLPETFDPILLPYSYLTSGIPALDRYLASNPPAEYWGLFSLLPVSKILVGWGLASAAPSEIGPFYLIPFPQNTYTFLNVFYSDFGMPGVFGVPFALGVVSTWLHKRFLERPSLLNTVQLALLLYCLAISVFGNKFVSTFIWELAAVGFMIAIYVNKPVARSTTDRATLAPVVDRSQG